MVHVIATVTLNEGKRDEFLKHFHELMPKVHAEDGCIDYGPTIDADSGIPRQGDPRPDVAVIVERWESLDHLKAHLEAPHMGEYREKVKDLVAGVTLQILEPA